MIRKLITNRRSMLIGGSGVLASLSAGMAFSKCDATLTPGGLDDSTAIQAAIARVHHNGGGTLRLAAGAVFRCRNAPVVLEGVTLDLGGSTLELVLANGNDQGVRLRSNATLCNGTIRVLSRGTPSLQAGAHAPVCIGPLYGEGGTASNLSPDEGVTGWTIRDLVLSSDKQVATPTGPLGAVAIQITGGASKGLVERITVPDSDTLSGAVHLDWGTIGPIVSADEPAGLLADRRAFDAGTGWTTHPHMIVIRDIRIGRLTGGQGGPDGGADAIRLSGCHHVTVSRVRAAATSGVFLRHTAGDLGLEYAREDAGKTLLGNSFTDCIVEDCLNGRLFVSDSQADNVARGVARGYVSRLPTTLPTDVIFDRVSGVGNGKAEGGVFVTQQGGGATHCRASGFATGFVCDAGVSDIVLTACTAEGNAVTGFLIEHVGEPPRNCRLVASVARDNGAKRPGSANITVGASIATTIDGGNIGNAAQRDDASYGIRIKERRDGCIDAAIVGDPLIASHARGGAAILASSEEGWGALRLFAGARYGKGVERRWIGLSIVPVAIGPTGRRILATRDGRSPADGMPSSFPHQPGDTFRQGPIA